MKEIPFFFNSGNNQLFAILHSPSDPSKKQGFIFCHPFAEEKLWSHRVFVNYARILAKMGYSVMRFDYMGHGDSSGHFEDSDVETRLKDITIAVTTLEHRMPEVNKIGLIGLRFGGTLAAMAVERIPRVSPLVLWEPVVKAAQHMKEMIRINLTTQTAVYKEIRFNTDALISQLRNGSSINIDGYEIRKPLYDQFIAIDLSNSPSKYKGPVLAVQINKREGLGTKRIDEMVNNYEDISLLSVTEQPFWKEIKEYYTHAPNLFSETTKWLKQYE